MEQIVLTLEDGYESLDRCLSGQAVDPAGSRAVTGMIRDRVVPGAVTDRAIFELPGGVDTGRRSGDGAPRRILLVCGRAFSRLRISHYLAGAEGRLGVRFIHFDDFRPNPDYGSVVKGVELFRKEGCEAILAVGGGSAIDVAKCIKLYAYMDPSKSYLEQRIVPNKIPLIAVPTTAGTGSEATRFAVIYHHGEKQSVTDASCIPSVVFFDPTALETLPAYPKKAAMLDALCHGIESFWSVHSTEESKVCAREAIRLILRYMDVYLSGECTKDRGTACGTDPVNTAMLRAADLAGRAIDITQTTAGHAMSYKLTSLYGIAHGHAVALCVASLWPYMLSHMEDCIDPRGSAYLRAVFGELAEAFGYESKEDERGQGGQENDKGKKDSRDQEKDKEDERDRDKENLAYAAAAQFAELVRSLGLDVPVPAYGDIDRLSQSVNPERLKNNPIRLDQEAIEELYHQILDKV